MKLEPDANARSQRPPRGRGVPFVRLAIFFHLVRRMAPPLLFVLLYTLTAALVVTWDMERTGEGARPLGEELYGMYTQLFFEPTESLPQAPLARAVFWITPLVGVVLIAEGLVKIGSTLLSEQARRDLWVRVMTEKMLDHVIVVGLGHVGYRVVESLLRRHEAVVAIERQADGFIDSVRAMNVPVLVGDARRDELLVEAGVERARAVVCATDDDLVNLEVALDAKRMNPDVRVVMRMFDQRLANKVGGALELDETFSTSSLAAPLIALQATHAGVKSAYQTDSGEGRVAVELELGPRFKSRNVAQFEDEVEARVVTARAKGADAPVRARGETPLGPGSSIVVDVPVDGLAKLRAILG